MSTSSVTSEDTDETAEISQNNIQDVVPVSNRSAALVTKILEFYRDGSYTDVKIESRDAMLFMCHRIVLAASSKYFHKKFSENTDEGYDRTILLANIHSKIFKQMLLFMYEGEMVAIDDVNVYDLLHASDFLGVKEIEDHCIHYLIQKSIPESSATPDTKPLALKPFDPHSDRTSELMKMSKKDLETNWVPAKTSSVGQEVEHLNFIFRWVRRSGEICNAEKKSYFIDVVRWMQFKFISDAGRVFSEYFIRNAVNIDTDEDCRSISSSDLSVSDSTNVRRRGEPSSDVSISDYVSTRTNVLSMNVYLETVDVKRSEFYEDDCFGRPARHTSVFSLGANVDDGGIDWYLSRTIEPPIEKMRVVEVNDRLYSLKLSDGRWTFSSSADIDLATDVQFLDLPYPVFTKTRNSFAPFSLCCLRGCIFVNGFNCNRSFIQEYNTVLGEWYSHCVDNAPSELVNMTSDGTRLYLIFQQPSSSEFVALDPRMKRGVLLNCDGFNNIKSCTEPPCFHEGRLYLPEDDIGQEYINTPTFKMAVYDPRANRWDIQNVESHRMSRSNGRRLASFNDRLWMFSMDGDSSCIYTQTYDSRAQFSNEKYCPFFGLLGAVMRWNLQSTNFNDVIVF